MICRLSVNISDLEYRFPGTKHFHLSIDRLNYTFNGPLGLYGLSGSGKTTFSKLLAGVLEPQSGSIAFESDKQIQPVRIIYSPQFPENILLGVQVGDTVQKFTAKAKTGKFHDSIQDYLHQFSLDYHAIKAKNGYELSGGELRRLAIALSLAQAPDLLILDEPTIGLGRRGKQQLSKLLETFKQKHHLMIVSHDFSLIRKMCYDFWILHHGKVIFTGDLTSLEKEGKIKADVGIDALKSYLEEHFLSKEIRPH